MSAFSFAGLATWGNLSVDSLIEPTFHLEKKETLNCAAIHLACLRARKNVGSGTLTKMPPLPYHSVRLLPGNHTIGAGGNNDHCDSGNLQK